MQTYKNLSTEDLPGEEWLPISGYESRYHISNLGRVKSLPKPITIFHGSEYLTKEKILKQRFSESNGYLFVALFSGSRETRLDIQVHILVSRHFIPNPEFKKEVNHKAGNKLDNRASELEWNTRKENIKHAYDNKLMVCSNTGKFGLNANYSRKVQCLVTGRVMCVKDAALFTEISTTHMCTMLSGKQPNWSTFIYY